VTFWVITEYPINIRMNHNIAPCGINCNLCHTYQRGNCPGCRYRAAETRKSCGNCVILQCHKYNRYCYECERPCKRLKTLDQRYRTKYTVSLLENLDYIRQNGEQGFIAAQIEKFKCPACGNLRTVHYDYCIYCKMLKSKPKANE